MNAKNKPKVLCTTTRLMRGGGVERTIELAVQELGDEFEFHVLSGVDVAYNPFENDPKVKLIVLEDMLHKIHPWYDLKAIWKMSRLIRKEKYDIVHTNETKASLVSRLAAKLAGHKYVVYQLHGVTFNDPMSSLRRSFLINVEKFTVWAADIILAVGTDTIGHYHKNKIARKIPYEIVRSAVDMDVFLKNGEMSDAEKSAFREEFGIPQDNLVLVNVGRFSPSKAQRFSIEVFAELKKEFDNITLLFVGEGETMAACQQQAKDLGVADDVVFAGFDKRVPKFLAISDIFIFTSLREGVPRVIVEAALLKVAIASYTVEGVAEVVEDGKSGYIVPQYDNAALVDRIRSYIKNPDLRKEFTDIAYAYAVKEWDAKRFAKQLRDVYNRRPKK